MAIEVQCDCGKTFKAPNKYAGKTGRCPACGRELEVPVPDHAKAAREPPRLPEAPPERPEEAAPSPAEPQPPPEREETPPSLPWQERQRHGFFRALLRTLSGVLFRPTQTFSSIQIANSLGSSVLYALILGTAGAWINYATQLALGHALAGAAAQGEAVPAVVERLAERLLQGTPVVLPLLAPLTAILASFVGAGLLHLCLMLVGGANETFEATYAVAAHAQGSIALFAVIPVCGGLDWRDLAHSDRDYRACADPSHQHRQGRAGRTLALRLWLCRRAIDFPCHVVHDRRLRSAAAPRSHVSASSLGPSQIVGRSGASLARLPCRLCPPRGWGLTLSVKAVGFASVSVPAAGSEEGEAA